MPIEKARPQAASELREVSDARTLRALTHPVRIAIIEVLTLEGPKTATEVGELIGESPTTCSFHLRQLAKYGFVEEAGGGKGRARPWKISSVGMQVTARGDAESEYAANALEQLFRQRQLDRYQHWLEARSSYPKRWRQAAQTSEFVLYLTIDELEQLNEEMLQFLLPKCRERLIDPRTRPPGSVPVEMLIFSYPVGTPPADDGGAKRRRSER